MKFLSDILAKAGLVVDGVTQLNTVANATTDTDKFLVSDGGVVKYRTGAQIAGDIGPGNLSVSTVKHLVKLGEAAAKGQAVYVSSADGTNMIVSKASNAAEATSSKTLGLLETGGVLNDQVYVVTEGLLAGLDTSTAVAGDPVWLGTGGNLIYGLLNKPYAPAHLVFIGVVTRVQQNNGEIFVKVQNGFELKEIHDVQITTTPADNTVLSYETSSSLYKMKSISTLLGYTPVPTTRTLTINGTAYDLSADRSWSITAGVSSVSAGTGISVNSTTGAVIVTNTGLLSATAGSGISVSTSGGTLTVSNTGLLSALAGSGISVSTSGGTLSISNTGILSGVAGSGISVSTSGGTLTISNTGLLSALAGSGISVSTSGGTVTVSNTGVLSVVAGSGISVSTSGGTVTVTNTITNNNQLTNGAGYITGYTETDTLATVTARGATTSTVVSFTGGDANNSSVKLTGYNQRGGVGYHGFLEVTSTYGTVTNPNKYFRLDSVGSLQIINSGYTAAIFSLTDAGALSVTSSVTAGSFVKSGGTSSQFLKADGSVDSSTYATQTYVGTQIANLVASAPAALDTLNELAAALGNDANFSTTVTNSLAGKVPTTRTITINGTAYDLSADRSWTIVAGVSSVNAGTGVSVNSTTGAVTVSIGQSVATSAQVTFDSVLTTNNGNGTNYKVGDDAWIGDINLANTIRITGVQDATKGYIVFGNGDGIALGRSGTGVLTYGSATVWHSGNLTNLNQLTNGPGYLTAESDTLATVTGRGATTSTQVILNGGIRMGNAYLNPSGDLNHFHFNGTAIIPNTTTTASNASIGTAAYRWSNIFGGGFNISGTTGDVGYIATTFATAGTNGRILHLRDDKATVSVDSYISVGWTSSPGQDVYIGKRTTSGAGFLAIQNSSATELFTINLSSGNAGIQVSNPANKFQIGSVGSTGYGGNDLVIGNGTQVMAFYQSSSVSTWYTNTNFSLMPSGTGSTGNLGVGVTSPSYRVDIGGSLRLTGALVLDDTTSNVIQHRAGTDVNTLVTVGHGGFDHNGYLRIGGANVATQTWVQSQGYITPNSTVSGWIAFQASTQGTPIIKAVQQDSSNGYYLFQGVTGSTEVYRVDRFGNTNLGGSLYLTGTSSNNIYLGQASGTGVNIPAIYSYSANGTYYWSRYVDNTGLLYWVYNATVRMQLGLTGNLTISGTLTENSSVRWKENIQDLSGSLDKVEKLRGVSYNKKGDTTTEIGLIAEEVEEVYPEFVEYDQNGNPVGLHYTRLTAVLIESVKELKKEINELKNRN